MGIAGHAEPSSKAGRNQVIQAHACHVPKRTGPGNAMQVCRCHRQALPGEHRSSTSGCSASKTMRDKYLLTATAAGSGLGLRADLGSAFF